MDSDGDGVADSQVLYTYSSISIAHVIYDAYCIRMYAQIITEERRHVQVRFCYISKENSSQSSVLLSFIIYV